jgi:site-specific recombinase XerD
LIADAEKDGIDKNTLIQVWQTNPVARHSFFQNLIADGMKYRLAQRNVPRAAARPVPQVQRPGVTSDDRNSYSEYAMLSRQLPKELTAKQAAQLLTARRNAR